VLGIGIAALVLFVNFALPHRMRLIGVALLLVPQIYVPELPVTVAFLWTLLTCLAGWMAKSRPPASSSLVAITALFVAAIAASLLWALPGGYDEGVVAVFRGLLFTLWLREVIVLAREEPALLDTIVIWCSPGILIQSIATIAFRLAPALEAQFHRSFFGFLTMGPNVERLYGDLPNNVLDPSKAGGLFSNGNHAAIFGGVGALVLIVAARRTGHRWLYGIAAVSIAGSAFSGSKGAVVIGIGCAAAILFLPYLLKGATVFLALPIVVLIPLIAKSAMELIAPSFYAASDVSIGGRQVMWSRAVPLFQESPIFGLGYGGWIQPGYSFGQRISRPPHNMIVAAWANSGLIAAMLLILFMVVAVLVGLRVAMAQTTLLDRRTAVIALCAITWVLLQGLGENTTLYGEQRSMILVAIAFGYLYALGAPQLDEPPKLTGDAQLSSLSGRQR
jgi:O-antigen ligase